MADDTDFIASNYPVPTFRFAIDLDGDGETDLRAASVGGLDQQFGAGEYRDGMGGLFRFVTRAQLPEVTMKDCVLSGRSSLYEWLSDYSGSTSGKRDVTVSLTDESGKVLYVTWNLANAFPTGITAPSVDASTGEVAVKQITLNSDRITVTCH